MPTTSERKIVPKLGATLFSLSDTPQGVSWASEDADSIGSLSGCYDLLRLDNTECRPTPSGRSRGPIAGRTPEQFGLR